MHDFGNHGQGGYGPRSHPGSEQQVSEVGWATIGRRRQIAVEPSRVNIAGANMMMPRQIQMRQIQMRQIHMRQVWLSFASIQDRQLARDAVWSQ